MFQSIILKTEETQSDALQMVEPVLPAVFGGNDGIFLKARVKDILFDGLPICENGGQSGGFVAGIVCQKILEQIPAAKTMRLVNGTIYFSNLHHVSRLVSSLIALTLLFRIKFSLHQILSVGRRVCIKSSFAHGSSNWGHTSKYTSSCSASFSHLSQQLGSRLHFSKLELCTPTRRLLRVYQYEKSRFLPETRCSWGSGCRGRAAFHWVRSVLSGESSTPFSYKPKGSLPSWSTDASRLWVLSSRTENNIWEVSRFVKTVD